MDFDVVNWTNLPQDKVKTQSSSEHGNEFLSSVKDKRFLDQLRHY